MQEAKMALPTEVLGEVSEIDPMARSFVVHSNSRVKGAKELNLLVSVTDKTIIRAGKEFKRFEDIKVGDKVWLKCERRHDTLTAESIQIKGHAE